MSTYARRFGFRWPPAPRFRAACPSGAGYRRRCLALLALATLVACRFGGPSENPGEYVTFDSAADAALGDEPVSQGDDGAATVTDATDAADATDATAATDATKATDAADAAGPEASAVPSGDANTSLGDGGDVSSPEGSVANGACATSVAVCDPVHNTGCNPFQQCDVDTTQTSTPTGLCVFNSGGVEGGGACTMSLVSESCAPHQTCVSGGCKALCFCDTDCPTGQCCSDTSGPPGFTLCGVCH